MTPLQSKVVDLALEMVKERGHNRVCTDELPDDIEILRLGVDEVADRLYIDTLYWEET